MKKINIFLLLILSTLVLSACAKQSEINQEAPLLNEANNINQEEANPIMSYNSESWKSLIPESCQAFSDGCNNCRRVEGSSDAACTMMFCETYQEPVCLD